MVNPDARGGFEIDQFTKQNIHQTQFNFMEKFLGQEVPEANRFAFLKDNADAIENVGYTRRYSPEELNEKKEELAKYAIEVSDIEEEKKLSAESFKERLKFPAAEKKRLIEQVKKSSEFVNEDCAKFIDHESKQVGFYNRLGELVYSRAIAAQEMQKTTFSVIRKTGTDN